MGSNANLVDVLLIGHLHLVVVCWLRHFVCLENTKKRRRAVVRTHISVKDKTIIARWSQTPWMRSGRAISSDKTGYRAKFGCCSSGGISVHSGYEVTTYGSTCCHSNVHFVFLPSLFAESDNRLINFLLERDITRSQWRI